MSEPITVSTLFSDISELARAFVERVSNDSLMLPSAVEVPAGQWVQFSVLLNDGTTAFAGLGRSTRIADRGAGAPAEARFEVLLDSLQFEEASQRVFDHLLLVSRAILQAEALPEEGASSSEWDDDAEVDSAELRQLSAASKEVVEDAQVAGAGPSAAQAQPSESEKNPYAGSILKRPVTAKGWKPEVAAPPERPRPSGLFRYNGRGLPRPARPPRPELDPEKKVTRAPRPADSKAAGPAASAQPASSSSKTAASAASSRPEPTSSRPAPVSERAAAVASSRPESSPSAQRVSEPGFQENEADELTPVEPLETEELTPVEQFVEADGQIGSPAFPQEQITAEIKEEELKKLLTVEEPPKIERRKSSRPPKPPKPPRRRR